MSQTEKLQMTDFHLKPIIMVVAVGGLFLLIYISPARDFLGNIHNTKEWLLSLGWKGPAVWMGIVFVLVASGTPRLLFCPIGGLAFGFWHGLLWTQLPTLAGYYVLFLFVRWGGKDFVLRHWSKVGPFKNYFHGHSSPLLVFAIRQIPMSGLIMNFLLGLSSTRHHHFLLGSALGILPEAIPITLVASDIVKINNQNTPFYMAIVIGILFIICAGLQYFCRHSKLLTQFRRETFSANNEENT